MRRFWLAAAWLAAVALIASRLGAAASSTRPPLPRLQPTAGLAFEIRDEDTGELMPGKITLLGARGTRDPQLSLGDISQQEDGAVVAYNRIFTIDGTGVVRVPPGTYDAFVSRGIEWSVEIRRVTLGAHGAEIRAGLRHVIDTAGWVSADFHVHAAMSYDSRVPMRDRVYEFAADGVELIVSTDHNVVADYAPYIQELGAERYLLSARGDEITTPAWGHYGAFPLPAALGPEGHGAIPARGRTAAAIFADVRRQAPGAIIDLHHPRMERKIGYLNVGKFDGAHDRAGRVGFSFDFDAIEILNGYQDPDRKQVAQLEEDWFGLLDHGHLVTATGNSDTHHMTYNMGGSPRNFVRVGDDDLARLTVADVTQAVKAHRALFTTGPFVRLTAGKAEVGDVVSAKGGSLEVTVDVTAAPWVDVSRVELLLGGKLERAWPVAPSTEVARLHEQHTFTLTADTYVVARVTGEQPLGPVVGDAAFPVRPFALTNPIFIDVDGNGRYDPPLPHGSHAPKDKGGER